MISRKVTIISLAFVSAMTFCIFGNTAVEAWKGIGSDSSGTDKNTKGCSGGSYSYSGHGINCCGVGDGCPHYEKVSNDEFREMVYRAGGDPEAPPYNQCGMGEHGVVAVVTYNEKGERVLNNDHTSSGNDYKTLWEGAFDAKYNGGQSLNDMTWDNFSSDAHSSITIGATKAQLLYGDNSDWEGSGKASEYSANGSDEYNLSYFCPDMIVTKGNFISKSKAKAKTEKNGAVANTGYVYDQTAEGQMEVDVTKKSVSVTVTFKHWLKINGGKAPLSTSYTISGSSDGGASAPSGGGGNASFSDNKAQKFDGGSTTVNIPKGSTQSYRVCSKVEYQNGDAGQNWTEACITINGDSSPEEELDNICDALKSDADMALNDLQHEPEDEEYSGDDPPTFPNNYWEGHNGAATAVWNPKTKDLTLGSETEDGENPVVMKPRDRHRFVHCYYPDAYNVSKVTEDEVPGDGEDPIVEEKYNNCGIYAEDTSYIFTEIESLSVGGNKKLKCGELDYKRVKSTDPNDIIISFSPKRKSTDYSEKKGYADIGEVLDDDVGLSWQQHVKFNGDHIKETWEDYPDHIDESCIAPEDEEEAADWEEPEGCPIWIYKHRKIKYKEIWDAEEYDESYAAYVAVPLNFDTEIEHEMISSADVVYPGSTVDLYTEGEVISNTNEQREKTYATTTPDGSHMDLVVFLLPPEAAASVPGPNNNSSQSPQAIASSLGATEMLTKTLATGPFNEDSNNGGDDIGEFDDLVTVPDVETGTKICSVAGVTPSDSHGTPGDSKSGSTADLDSPGMLDAAESLVDSQWNVTGVSCRTIVKKPSFQAWNGGVYSGYGIETSVTDKCVAGPLTWGNTCTNKQVFGSWSEYEAIAGVGAIKNFASGAGLGYSSTPSFPATDFTPGSANDGVPSNTFNSNFFSVSKITIANNNTNGPPISATGGRSGIYLDGSLLERILSHYANIGSDGHSQISAADQTSYDVRGCGSTGSISGLEDGKVIIYRCSGTVNITGDIIVGDRTYTQIDHLPQVIIIANKINISANVERVDAWLIASNPDTPSETSATGTINTCEGFASGSTQSSDPCGTHKLQVNGPVIAKKLYLNRTYGSFPGPGASSSEFGNQGSSVPAERFNLRPDAYLWAYSQSEDFHQVFTVYSRELAPRY